MNQERHVPILLELHFSFSCRWLFAKPDITLTRKSQHQPLFDNGRSVFIQHPDSVTDTGVGEPHQGERNDQDRQKHVNSVHLTVDWFLPAQLAPVSSVVFPSDRLMNLWMKKLVFFV